MPLGSNDKEFLIRVKADLAQARKEFGALRGELDKSTKGTGALAGGLKKLAVAGLAFISLHMAADLAKTADNFNTLQDRIRTATREFGDYNTVSRELFAISQRNGTALEANVDLFQRIARSAPELKATQEQVLAVTNAVNQLGVIGGSTREQLNNGLLQLSQAFSSNVFRAEELNSVIENTPEIANRIAKGLGLTVGQMRQLVIQGKLASKDAFGAILKQTDDIDKQFQDIPNRLSRAGTRFSNAFASALSDIDKSIGLTTSLAEALDKISDNLAPLPRTVKEITADLDRLQEKYNSLTRAQRSRGRGSGIQADIRALREELQAALASSSDVNEVNQALDDVEKRLSAVNELINAIPEAERRVNSGSGRNRGRTDYARLLSEADALDKQRLELVARIAELNKPPKSGGGEDALTPEQIKAQEEIKKTIESLQAEAVQYEATRSQLVLYELAMKGATQEQLNQAQAALQASEAAEEWNARTERAKEIIESLKTPTEKYIEQVRELWDLYEHGNLSTAQLTESLKKAKQEFEDLAKKADDSFKDMEAAIRGWGDEFTDTIVDAVTTGKANFKDLADSIIRDLLRIALQKAFVDNLVNWYGGLFSASSSGGGTTVATGHTGGMASNLTGRASVPASLFAGAPRFHTGFPGLAQNELPAILRTDERVLNPEQTRAYNAGMMQGGGGPSELKVEINNKGTPQQATDVQSRFDGRQFIVSVVTDDIGRNGQVATTLSRTFNLQRKSG